MNHIPWPTLEEYKQELAKQKALQAAAQTKTGLPSNPPGSIDLTDAQITEYLEWKKTRNKPSDYDQPPSQKDLQGLPHRPFLALPGPDPAAGQVRPSSHQRPLPGPSWPLPWPSVLPSLLGGFLGRPGPSWLLLPWLLLSWLAVLASCPVMPHWTPSWLSGWGFPAPEPQLLAIGLVPAGC